MNSVPDFYEPRPSQPLTDCVRDYPTLSVLGAIVLGVAAGVLVRALAAREETTSERAFRLMSDLRDRITDITSPALERASAAAGDGLGAVQGGLERLRDLPIDRTLSNLGKRVRGLFS